MRSREIISLTRTEPDLMLYTGAAATEALDQWERTDTAGLSQCQVE